MLSLVLATMMNTEPDISSLIAAVDQSRLKATVAKLSSFHTRNTLSPGLTEACEWIAEEYRKIPGVEAEVMRYRITKSRRVPEDMDVVQVVATLRGKTDRMLLTGGHIDSLNLSVDPVTGRAPGANDDASGVALALEACRVLAGQEWNQTIKFVAFSGEEQGLFGSTALAKRAVEEKWDLEAVLSADTVGSSSNIGGQSNTAQIRVFSEDGEDHQSRELARFLEWNTAREVPGFGVKLVFRRDRFGRGGDHTPFVREGITAVRLIEVHEEFTQQHTPDDVIEHMDFEYLANGTRVTVAGLARLASAAEQPDEVRISRRQGHDTNISWVARPGVEYRVYWRETTSAIWQGTAAAGPFEDSEGRASVEMVNKDDHTFAVGAVGGIPVVAG
jgi:hypothetical protein